MRASISARTIEQETIARRPKPVLSLLERTLFHLCRLHSDFLVLQRVQDMSRTPPQGFRARIAPLCMHPRCELQTCGAARVRSRKTQAYSLLCQALAKSIDWSAMCRLAWPASSPAPALGGGLGSFRANCPRGIRAGSNVGMNWGLATTNKLI